MQTVEEILNSKEPVTLDIQDGVIGHSTVPSRNELIPGEVVNLGGFNAKVLHFTKKSVTVRPKGRPVLNLKGVLVYIDKILPNGDMVLKIVGEK